MLVEGNVAVGLMGFNLVGIYSSSLMINSGRCYLILFVSIVYRQSPRPVVARLLVRLARSLHVAATSITAGILSTDRALFFPFTCRHLDEKP